MKQYPFGTFGPEHLKKVKEGIECFNQKKYWECHEALEDIWLEERNDPARNVYWAIIQVATSLYHVREKNIKGAEGMLSKAKRKFERCHKLHVVTDIMNRFLQWKEFEGLVNEVPANNSRLNDYKDLYQFQFTSYPYLRRET